MGIKITADSFVWRTLTVDDATAMYEAGFPVFALYDDESESLLENEAELNKASSEVDLGLQVGFIEYKEKNLFYSIEKLLRGVGDNEEVEETTGYKTIQVYKFHHNSMERLLSVTLKNYEDTEFKIKESLNNEYDDWKLILI